jgi:hypothetical protein
MGVATSIGHCLHLLDATAKAPRQTKNVVARIAALVGAAS